MGKKSAAQAAWDQFSGLPCGKWLFSRALCWKAPYFGTIRPLFVSLRAGHCEVRMKKRRSVTNHLGTVHAIAMCNLAELVGGTMTDVSVPTTHRWIPKGMTVEYLRKATTDLRGVATLEPIPAFGEAQELPVTVEVFDTAGEIAFRAVITMWVTPKKG